MIFTKTPFRVSFFGGGTDFQKYFKKRKSVVIGTAIDKYIYIFLNKFYSNLFDHNIRIFYSKNEFVKFNYNIKHKVINKIFINENLKKDVELHILSELPSYIGLGSSSSFTVGLLKLINSFKKKQINKKKLADKAIYTEQFLLNENVGYQDQILASYGGINAIKFEKDKFKVEPIKTKFEIKKLIDNLFLVYTGIKRSASDIENKKFSPSNEKKIKYLDNINELSFEAYDCFRKSKSIDFFGDLLHRTWVQKKKIHKVVSNKIIDNIYDKGIEAGARGGKLLGAGAGGFVLFYVDKNKQSKFLKAFNKKNYLKFNIDYNGSRTYEIK